MKQDLNSQKGFSRKIRTIAVLTVLFSLVIFMGFGIEHGTTTTVVNIKAAEKDSVASTKAFMQVYKVLMSPRCMNCHPSGDIPLQGDDSHLHAMFPKRGVEGKGVTAMKCMNCHQPKNVPGLNTPPGDPNWHLPPANMKMVFQGRTPAQLAKQLVNPKTNGNKTMEQLIAHADDGLVKAGWNPGEGRTLPPLSHAEFKKEWIQWIKTGAFAPKDK
ncbi:hypothetical protein [Pedobacter sp.]|uniref:hypothetical protein n=1 Tax=Pedobacter sp. TaxID=1411316 RepID=UPI003BAD152B